MRQINRRTWLKFIILLAITALASFSYLAVISENSSTTSTLNPTNLPSTTQSAPPQVLENYTFYFVGDTARGLRLYKEVQIVDVGENELGSDKGLNALTMLVTGQLPPFDGDH